MNIYALADEFRWYFCLTQYLKTFYDHWQSWQSLLANLARRAHQVTLGVAADVVCCCSEKFQVGLKSVCFEDILGETPMWTQKKDNNSQIWHGSIYKQLRFRVPSYLLFSIRPKITLDALKIRNKLTKLGRCDMVATKLFWQVWSPPDNPIQSEHANSWYQKRTRREILFIDS